jgi:hypothetical protein
VDNQAEELIKPNLKATKITTQVLKMATTKVTIVFSITKPLPSPR